MRYKKYNRRKQEIPVDDLVSRLQGGERVALAQAITLVESNSEYHFEKAQDILQSITNPANPSVRIGITGVPGVGKSTFIDTFGMYLCEKGLKVAVLAVDPSSQVSKGSILGDKTRMERLARHKQAFIRPSPSSGTLGGVNRKTRETILLCEAAGFDVILIETVGVGQGEFVVRSMVDFFLLLVLTGAGDELQTMKKGIMELPDLIVVNKADGDNLNKAIKAEHEYNTILHFLKPYTEGWTTKAMRASALKEIGIEEIWKTVERFFSTTKENGVFSNRRMQQKKDWLYDMIKEQLAYQFFHHPLIKEKIPFIEKGVLDGEKTVANSVEQLIAAFMNAKGLG
ncbi:methylmalonyl Co-A mutase-associated GTPase MeaB [Metabacillus arenae]|uniref:Methylmalonyl Co-A mutase-associated GTPase MeaB n=1 Tax=Metabacillus arenae TaxID=2771434 RepID=A0A926RW29_9BACI|nr:methylmalonyl Co-A mutase-associated GTPase MeaB [Metabacillus arenae]MBD1378767.1 methylmalonyl Co-A mutase-associated GTPase MeaB [Metabacillus arenae]